MNKYPPQFDEKTVNTGRIAFIDRAKGLAIFLVVFDHVFMQMQFPDDEAMLHLKTFQFIAVFHMPLFFFLSGLVTRSAFCKIKEIAIDSMRRIRMILIPALLVGSIMAIYKGNTIVDFLEAHMKFGYWYLFVLFEMYLLNYVFSWICNNIKHWGWIGELVIGLLIYVAISIIYRFLPEQVWHILSFHKLVSCYPFFFCGVMVKRHNISSWIFSSEILYTLSLIFLFIYLLFPQISFYRKDMVLCFTMIILLVGILYRAESKRNWLLDQFRDLGVNSLFIYILHGFVFSIVNLSFIKSVLSVDSYYSVLLEMLIGIVISIPIVYITLWLGKAIQSSKIIMKIVFNK